MSGSTFRMAAKIVLGKSGEWQPAAAKAVAWALNSATVKPDMLIIDIGILLAFTSAPGQISSLLRECEAVFQQVAALVAAQDVPRTRLVMKSTTLTHGKNRDPAREKGNRQSWTSAWTDVEPMVKAMAHFYNFAYYDVAAVAQAAVMQELQDRWDTYHFYQSCTRNSTICC